MTSHLPRKNYLDVKENKSSTKLESRKACQFNFTCSMITCWGGDAGAYKMTDRNLTTIITPKRQKIMRTSNYFEIHIYVQGTHKQPRVCKRN